MDLKQLEAYELLEQKTISDIQSGGYLLRHKKTGARIALLSNEDNNKVFYIGFRTPVSDSTGVPHIIEHSVLCGSEKFPVKDPFVELVKGSLNTFLNAMTYPDKTVYPVASCNDKDFQNLMHIYLDAVFHPNIYQREEIFRQEGWHYELDEAGNLIINGVVYNEMKGAFSSSEEVLSREISTALYPDTGYAKDSGGDPEVIPSLTYEEFLSFHRSYYHPSNSYIYLYGDMDMVEKLEFIDREYLSKYEAIEIDSAVKVQPCFEEAVQVNKSYPIEEEEDMQDSTYLSVNYSVGRSTDPQLYLAFQLLDAVLGSIPGAPLKQALLDCRLGKDIYTSYDNGLNQPIFSIVSKGVSADRLEEFLRVIEDTLRELCRKGLNKRSLLATLNSYEFKFREADFGSYPKGLMYGLQMLDSWLYDDMAPFVHLMELENYKLLREKLDTDYFEQLIEQYLLENTHKAIVVLEGDKGLAAKKEEAFSKKLKEIKDAMSPLQLEEIKETHEKLKRFQETEDSEENLNKIPMLRREDLNPLEPEFQNEEITLDKNTMLLYHNIYTNGIAYIRACFDTRRLPEEDYFYISIIKQCLCEVSTEHYSYGDLFNEAAFYTGGLTSNISVSSMLEDVVDFNSFLELNTKVLYPNMEKAIELIGEILCRSIYSDEKRLLEILEESKVRLSSNIMSAGHMLAIGRALSYTSQASKASDLLNGVGFYKQLCNLLEHFEEGKEQLIKRLQEVAEKLFTRQNLSFDFTGDEAGLELAKPLLNKLIEELPEGESLGEKKAISLEHVNEGFMNSSQVVYVCRAGNFLKHGLTNHGALKALKVILGYDYLWNQVRVKGGAYGCMCNFANSGECYFVSYRDPNLEKTIEAYEGAVEYVRQFQADERTMTKYIIGAISELDTPRTPSSRGTASRSAYLSGNTWEKKQKYREELLHTTPEDIRRLAAYIEGFLSENLFCTAGNSNKIKEQENKFGKIENLF